MTRYHPTRRLGHSCAVLCCCEGKVGDGDGIQGNLHPNNNKPPSQVVSRFVCWKKNLLWWWMDLLLSTKGLVYVACFMVEVRLCPSSSSTPRRFFINSVIPRDLNDSRDVSK